MCFFKCNPDVTHLFKSFNAFLLATGSNPFLAYEALDILGQDHLSDHRNCAQSLEAPMLSTPTCFVDVASSAYNNLSIHSFSE